MYHNTRYESLGKNLIDLLNKEQHFNLLAKSKERHFKTGQTLFHMGDKAEYFYLVLSGAVKLFRINSSGDEKVFNQFYENDLIAEMSIFMPSPSYPMHAQAIQSSQVLAIPANVLKQEISSSSELSQKVISFMSMRVLNLVNQVDKLTFSKVEQRLVLHLAYLYLDQRGTNGKVKIPVSQRVLADQLSVSAETLSRQFSRLKKLNLLEKLNENEYLLKINALCQAVDLAPGIFTSSPYDLESFH